MPHNDTGIFQAYVLSRSPELEPVQFLQVLIQHIPFLAHSVVGFVKVPNFGREKSVLSEAGTFAGARVGYAKASPHAHIS